MIIRGPNRHRRNSWYKTALAILPLLAPLQSTADQPASPSFDCKRAAGKAQLLVCADAQLAALDRETARLYALASKSPQLDTKQRARLRAYQIGWIRGRDDCWKADDLHACVLDNYTLRIHELRRDYPDARVEAPDSVSRGPFAVACEGDDAALAVTFINTDPALACLEAQGSFYSLPQTPTASGARYATGTGEEEVSLWNKGDEARVTLPGKTAMSCKVAPGR
jgi:uncharacterized protein